MGNDVRFQKSRIAVPDFWLGQKKRTRDYLLRHSFVVPYPIAASMFVIYSTDPFTRSSVLSPQSSVLSWDYVGFLRHEHMYIARYNCAVIDLFVFSSDRISRQ